MAEKAAITKHEILKMAKDLGMALGSSQILADYRQAEMVMANDEKACYLTSVFKIKHRELALLMTDPYCKEEDKLRLEEELEKADSEMKSYPPIAAYYELGSSFNQLIYQINQLLKFYSMEDQESIKFGASSGCNGCGGGKGCQ